MAFTVTVLSQGPNGFRVRAAYDGNSSTGVQGTVTHQMLLDATKPGSLLRRILEGPYANSAAFQARLAKADVRITPNFVNNRLLRYEAQVDSGATRIQVIPSNANEEMTLDLLVEYVHTIVQ